MAYDEVLAGRIGDLVGAEPDVELDPAHAGFARGTETRKGVLRRNPGRAAMTDHPRQVEHG